MNNIINTECRYIDIGEGYAEYVFIVTLRKREFAFGNPDPDVIDEACILFDRCSATKMIFQAA